MGVAQLLRHIQKRGAMGIRLYREPEVENPVLVASWPGIGNIGMVAVDTLRGAVRAEEFGEIEPWDYFYPNKIVIRNGELVDLEFPTSKFYFARTKNTDLIFFIGEEQPTDGEKAYAEGEKACQMANLVLDVAIELGCRKVYTSGAAVTHIHHTVRPRVWAVPNTESLVDELRGYNNTVLMSEVEGRRGQGSITGLNGLLLGAARRRGLDAVCVMGEIPIYLQGFPFPYPKASKSVLEVLTSALGLRIGMEGISEIVEKSEREIDKLYKLFPSDIREQLDKLRSTACAGPTDPGPITDEDKRRILDDIDKLFKK